MAKMDEMETSTLRNRSVGVKNSKKEPVTPTPSLPKEAKKKGITAPQFKKAFEKHEHSPEDIQEDKKRAHALHITVARYEMTPEDRRKDIRGSINTAIRQIKGRNK